MSQDNVEIASRYYDAILRRLAQYWDEPISLVEAVEAGELDPTLQDVFALMHPEIRFTNTMGDRYEGKIGCARACRR